MIIKEKLDLAKLFEDLDMSKDKALDVNEYLYDILRLAKFLTRIDKNLTREEIEYLFNKFDEDGSNSIEFEEFRKWLEDNECKMTSASIIVRAKRLSILTLPG